MNDFKLWLSSLPSEYQTAIAFALMMCLCFFIMPLSDKFDKNIAVIVTGLGSLALGVLTHGGVARFKKEGSDTDLIGKPDAKEEH